MWKESYFQTNALVPLRHFQNVLGFLAATDTYYLNSDISTTNTCSLGPLGDILIVFIVLFFKFQIAIKVTTPNKAIEI